jgi:hypothetical protein
VNDVSVPNPWLNRFGLLIAARCSSLQWEWSPAKRAGCSGLAETFGYNMFFFPSPNGLAEFFEHTHRLIASTVGFHHYPGAGLWRADRAAGFDSGLGASLRWCCRSVAWRYDVEG